MILLRRNQIQQMLDGKIIIRTMGNNVISISGEIIWVMVSTSVVRNSHGKALYFISQLQNISAQKKAEEQLRYMAYHDSLTGLANRNKLEEYIQQALGIARRHQRGFALLFMDLDHFKNINDTIGHDAGDLLLQIVAERLKSIVRSTDIVARLGGDEFIVVVTDVVKAEVGALVAQKILSNLLNPL